MPRAPRWDPLARKAIAACLAAIEVYNKPTSPHREDTFAILTVCAWEALLKARIARDIGYSALFITDPVRKKSGEIGARRRQRLNRSGNPMTIGIEQAMTLCESLTGRRLDPVCRRNIDAMIEIRDNAMHFYSDDRELAQRGYEVGAATLANFTRALDEWFEMSPRETRFSILPLSFEPLSRATSLVCGHRPKQIAKLLEYLEAEAAAAGFQEGGYACMLHIETRLVGGRQPDAIAIRLTSDHAAPKMFLTDDQVRKGWPLNYEILQRKLRTRKPEIRFNSRFNEAMRKIKLDRRLSLERKLNPSSSNSPRTWFYSDAAVDAVLRESGHAPAPSAGG